mmetsp:Transcript_6742/g.10962  ORF Transcript_6742/g.10962 Transcript_6742/m.10962 type:complete len:208 (+) Transcript_6742:358-981(+)
MLAPLGARNRNVVSATPSGGLPCAASKASRRFKMSSCSASLRFSASANSASFLLSSSSRSCSFLAASSLCLSACSASSICLNSSALKDSSYSRSCEAIISRSSRTCSARSTACIAARVSSSSADAAVRTNSPRGSHKSSTSTSPTALYFAYSFFDKDSKNSCINACRWSRNSASNRPLVSVRNVTFGGIRGIETSLSSGTRVSALAR